MRKTRFIIFVVILLLTMVSCKKEETSISLPVEDTKEEVKKKEEVIEDIKQEENVEDTKDESKEEKGVIQNLQMQVVFVLAEKVKFKNEARAKPALRYLADFVYMQDGQQIVEDVKSKATRTKDTYRIKKHLMMSVHGIEITEV